MSGFHDAVLGGHLFGGAVDDAIVLYRDVTYLILDAASFQLGCSGAEWGDTSPGHANRDEICAPWPEQGFVIYRRAFLLFWNAK